MEQKLKIVVEIILSILFIGCLFKMPYGYFQIVRIIGMGSFIWLAYLQNKNNEKSLTILWACSAILINPIIKIPLGRQIWNIVDIVWVIIIFVTLIIDFTKFRKNNI